MHVLTIKIFTLLNYQINFHMYACCTMSSVLQTTIWKGVTAVSQEPVTQARLNSPEKGEQKLYFFHCSKLEKILHICTTPIQFNYPNLNPHFAIHTYIRDTFYFFTFLFYFTAPPKKMPKCHPINEHILIFL